MYFVKPPDPPPILTVWMFLKNLFRAYSRKEGLKMEWTFAGFVTTLTVLLVLDHAIATN